MWQVPFEHKAPLGFYEVDGEHSIVPQQNLINVSLKGAFPCYTRLCFFVREAMFCCTKGCVGSMRFFGVCSFVAQRPGGGAAD